LQVNNDITALELRRTAIYNAPNADNVKLLDSLAKQITELAMKKKSVLEVRATHPGAVPANVLKDYARANFLESSELLTIKQFFLGKILDQNRFNKVTSMLIEELSNRLFCVRGGVTPLPGNHRYQISICNHNYRKKCESLIFATLVIKSDATDWIGMVSNVTNDTLTKIIKFQNEKKQETTTEKYRDLNDNITSLQLENKMLVLLAQNKSLSNNKK